jgi:hypothetical protein
MFSLFKPKPPKNEHLAYVKFFVNDGDDSVRVDINLDEYDVEPAVALCNILHVIGSGTAFSETVQLLKAGMVQAGHDELFQHIINELHNLLSQTKAQGQGAVSAKPPEDEPCIKPSDLL